MRQQRQEVLAHHPAHHRADRQPPRLLVGLGDEHLAHQPPVAAPRRAAADLRAPASTLSQCDATYAGLRFSDSGRKPRSPASLSVSEFFDSPATPIGGCGVLQRLDVRAQHAEHLLGPVDLPVLALVVERLLGGPQLQDDVQRLAGHVAVGARHAVDVVHRPVRRQPGRGDAEVQPTARRCGRASPPGWPARPGGGTAAGSRPGRCAAAPSATAPGRRAGRAPGAAPTARCGARRSTPRCSPSRSSSRRIARS